MIEFKDVTFKYDGITALYDVSVTVERGLKYALLGANGAGKTTFLLHLNGILRPLSGKIFYDGEEIAYNRRALSELRRRVGVVFQDPDSQLFSATVAEDVSFGPVNLGLSPDEVRTRVDEALASCGIDELKERPTHFLSQGQKKLAAIAGVLAMKPEVIVLDEPIAGLDHVHREKVLEIFSLLNESGVTLIMSTHEIDLAYEWADRIIVMKGGSVHGSGSPLEIFSNERLLNSTALAKPIVLAIHERLVSRGILKDAGKALRDRKELFDALE